ncbi:MAG TPA: Maf family nucleotide pyrophosphatase [Bacteroidales bacterium]|nr:Maf family nucleotide pyrophosphatase [Bacteroidales bacterium]
MIIDDLNKYRIILASRSPRRQQLLQELGIKFEVVVRDYDESYPEELKGKEIAEYLSGEKARHYLAEIKDNEIIITADTIVWCNDKVLGKPADAEEAKNMIRELSGNVHDVITGVTLLSNKKEKTFTDLTRVTFEEMSREEISYYVENFKPFDKAGAYGIQEWIGITACSRIEGSYFNVVGLPVQKLYKELKEFIR